MTNAPVAEGTEVQYVDIDVEIGITVQSMMFRRRMKQEEMAQILGVSGPSVSRKLRGLVGFSPAELIKIARAYEVDPGELLPRLDSNQQPCGYRSPQVSLVDSVTWGTFFDKFVSAEVSTVVRWGDWLDFQRRRGWNAAPRLSELSA